MRLTRPQSGATTAPPYNIVKINGCADTTIGFDLLDSNPTVSKRRYCNKVLVHECVSVPAVSPLALSKVEFLATSDSCYKFFEVFKSSETVDGVDPSITLELNGDDEVVAIAVSFLTDETCCLPLRMAYRLYGYDPDGVRILLTSGNLLVSPCDCPDGVTPQIWKEVQW